MSGTSLDGVDIAVIETDGTDVLRFGKTANRRYTPNEQAQIRAAFGLWPGDGRVPAAARVVEAAHADAMAGLDAVTALGFHGQTLAHDPQNGRTHQAGDGACLSDTLGLPVIWDFRSADMALGGHGAPLAPFYHWALARRLRALAPIAFLDLGGMGTISWVDPTSDAPEADGALMAFDTGPATAPLDDLMRVRRAGRYDTDGAQTSAGTADMAAVAAFLDDGYFLKMPPKSLDRNAFPYLVPAFETLSVEDALATLAACAAASVAQALSFLPQVPARVLVSGGGRHNRGLMAALGAALPCPVAPVETAGLDGDALEAQAIAYLAARVALGMTTSAPGTTGVPAAVGGGQVSGDLRLDR